MAVQKTLDALFKKLCRLHLYVINPMKIVALQGTRAQIIAVIPVRNDNLKQVLIISTCMQMGFILLVLI